MLLGNAVIDVSLDNIGFQTTPEDTTHSVDLSATSTAHAITATAGVGGTISTEGTTLVENGGQMTYIISPHVCSADGSVLGGHVDVDTSDFIAPINGNDHWGGIGGHVHEYDVKYGVTGVDFMDVEGTALKNIHEYITDGDQKFKLILGNTALSPGVRLVVNHNYEKDDASTYSLPPDYDDTPVADLPVYSLSGSDGTTQLTNLSFQFHVSAIVNRHVHPSQAINVMRNDLGPNGEWRNGALVLQAVAVNADGTDAFTLDTAKSNGGHGVAASGLLYEALVYWHWSGPAYSEAGWDTYDPGVVTYTDTVDCTNYEIEDVLVNGVSVGPVGSYTFENVTDSHTIEAIFSRADGDPNPGGDPVPLEENAFTYSAVVNSGNVTATVDGDTLDLVPDPNWFGPASVTVTVTDVHGNEDEETFVFDVTPVNDLPILDAIGDQMTVEDVPKVLNMSATDIEDDDNTLTYSVTNSTNISGSVVGGVVTLTPAPNWSGTEQITITVTDSEGGTDSETFDVVVTPVNDPPVLTNPDDETTAEDTPLVVDLDGTDIEDDDSTLTYTVVNSANITGVIVDDQLTLTPSTNWHGTETITVTVIDMDGATDTETFDVTVTPVNDPPVLTDPDDETTAEDTAIVVDLDGTDLEDDDTTLTYTVANSPNIAGVIVDDQLTLTSTPNWHGTETITVTVTDMDGATDTKTFDVTVSPVNDPPILTDPDDETTAEDTPIIVDLDGTDIEDDDSTLTYTVTNSPNITGIIVDDQLTLTSTPNWHGTETITVTVTDMDGATDRQTFDVTVSPVNDPPVLIDPADQTTAEDTPIIVDLDGTDIEDDDTTLTYTVTNSPNITGIIVDDELTLTSTPNWHGTETITVTVTDKDGSTDTQTFDVTVNPVNDPPVFEDPEHPTFSEDSTTTVTLTSTDVEDEDTSLVYTAEVLTGEVSVIITGDEIELIPDENWFGEGSVQITVTDEEGGIDQRILEFTVSPVNDSPILDRIPSQIVEQDHTLIVDLHAEDVDFDSLTFSSTEQSGNLTVITNGDELLITPRPGWTGTSEITVFVEDGNGGLVTRTFPIGVVPHENDPPSLELFPVQTSPQNAPTEIPLVGTDPNGDPLTYTLELISGEVTPLIEDGVLTLTPEEGWSGIATFEVTVEDGRGGIEIKTFQLAVNNDSNDPPSLTEIGNLTAEEDEWITLPVTATDPNGDPLTYDITVLSGDVEISKEGDEFVRRAAWRFRDN